MAAGFCEFLSKSFESEGACSRESRLEAESLVDVGSKKQRSRASDVQDEVR